MDEGGEKETKEVGVEGDGCGGEPGGGANSGCGPMTEGVLAAMTERLHEP